MSTFFFPRKVVSLVLGSSETRLMCFRCTQMAYSLDNILVLNFSLVLTTIVFVYSTTRQLFEQVWVKKLFLLFEEAITKDVGVFLFLGVLNHG